MMEWLQIRRILAVILLMGVTSEAFAQGCAMCLASATSQGPRAMEAMNLGIIILLIPPFVMIVAILLFTFLRRH
jgi:ABC-type sulfate transport system permease subunit